MATIKTAISIEKDLFDRVNELAEELQMPRSQVFVLAVQEFLDRHQNRAMLETLDDVYADGLDQSEEAYREAVRRRHRRLVEGEW